jgi:hypothetical protein
VTDDRTDYRDKDTKADACIALYGGDSLRVLPPVDTVSCFPLPYTLNTARTVNIQGNQQWALRERRKP